MSSRSDQDLFVHNTSVFLCVRYKFDVINSLLFSRLEITLHMSLEKMEHPPPL